MSYDYDLYLFIDYSPQLFSLYDKNYHPRAFYWWDATHHEPFSLPSQLAEMFDKTYFAEVGIANYMRFLGYHNVQWLPPAFYPEVYKPLPGIEKIYDFAFVGQLNHVVRRRGLTRYDFIAHANSRFNGFVSDNMISYDINKKFNQAKILIDRSVPTSLGTRFFEAIGSKGFFLTNRAKLGVSGVDLLAQDGIHYVSYDDTLQDFDYKFRYYLDRPAEREQIAQQGYDYFMSHHTYSHRLDVILRDFGLLK